MPAQVIYRSKSKDFNVNNAISEIKEAITNAVASQSGNVVECELNVWVCGHGFRPFGANYPNDFIDLTLEVGRKKWSGLGRADLSQIGKEIEKWAKGLGADIENCTLNFTYDMLHSDGEFPKTLRFFTEGCEEFKELQHLVMRDGINLNPKDLYRVRLFGKRGVYDESGSRSYLAYNPTECKKLIELVKHNNVKVKTIDDVEDLDLSIRYETECYGARLVTLVAA